MEVKYAFGIDLGTTYSCISYFDENGQVVVCPSKEGASTTPSVVRLTEGEDAIVGEAAKNTAVIFPDNTIQFVKARIGKDVSFNYGPDQSLTTTPIAVSAEILKKLAEDAGDYTNSLVKQVVITVPAYFGDPEKKATIQAGIDAGLDVLGIVEEPTAAALYYGITKSEENETVIVFDLGGGTFDVTALKIADRNYQVLTTDGNHDLGGKNWDAALIELVKSKFEDETGWDEGYDLDIEQDLILNTEKAKIMLTSSDKATVPVNIDRSHRAAIEITRQEFDDCTATLLEKAVSLTRSVMERVSEPIKRMLLVGGSTYMPQVKEALAKEFPDCELFINEPNSAVAKGAALFAYKLVHDEPVPTSTSVTSTAPSAEMTEEEVQQVVEEKTQQRKALLGTYEEVKRTQLGGILEEVQIKTVATKSLGLEVLIDGKPAILNLIMKDTVLPAEHKDIYDTAYDDTTCIPLKIYQINDYMETYDVDEDLMIGTAMLRISTKLPKGSPIEVTLSISEDGLIHVRGVDLTHNCEVEADIENDAIGQASN